MLKFILLSILYYFVLLCHAQQKIVFEKRSNGKVKSVTLPAVVYIKFKNTGYKELILERVSNDSFFFRKYYNQPENYDCSVTSFSYLKFPQKGDVFLHSAFTFFTGTSLLLTMFTVGLILEKSTEAGNPSQTLALVFGIPLSAISIITSTSLAKNLPKNFSTKKWSIYVK